MNYICDVLVNFGYPLYDFYDWNKNDNIRNIKKIPFYKTDKKNLNLFKYNKFKIINILDEIHNETQIYTNKKNKFIEYSLVLCDGDEAIVFNLDSKGICIGKSMMLPDEESEILHSSINISCKNIEYEIISNDNIRMFETRNQVKIVNYLVKTIHDINDVDKLNYIYFECFSKHSNTPKKELIDLFNSSWNDKYYKIYDFLHLIYMKKS